MAIDIIATPNAADANSFATLDQYSFYHARRLPLDPPVVVTGDIAARNLIMATRVLSSMMQARKTLRWDAQGKPFYYLSRTWTGQIATQSQSLAWGRTGMYNSLGYEISSTSIPQELVDATCELAGQLGNTDRTLDNDIAVQGITSVKAGSVALTFRENIQAQVLPDAVLNLLVPSWLTDEQVTYTTQTLIFEAV